MAGSTQPFRVTETVTIAATSASQGAALPKQGGSALIYNAGADVAFVAFGTSDAVTATPASVPVPPGGSRLIGIGPLVSWAAAIAPSAAGTVYITRGDGDAY